jgi:hypothetical protein
MTWRAISSGPYGLGIVPKSLSADSGFAVSLSVALAVKGDAVKLAIGVGFAYKSGAVSFKGRV